MSDHMSAVGKKRLKLGLPMAVKRGPPLPAEAAWLWGAFIALDDTRDVGMGVGAITHGEMLAYAALHGFRWQPFEIAIIRRLDRAFRLFRSKKSNVRTNANERGR